MQEEVTVRVQHSISDWIHIFKLYIYEIYPTAVRER